MYRYKKIRDIVKAEGEMEAMAIADRDSRRLRDYHRALSTVGRIVLGYKGRKIAKERRREARLEEVHTSYCMVSSAYRYTPKNGAFASGGNYRPRCVCPDLGVGLQLSAILRNSKSNKQQTHHR